MKRTSTILFFLGLLLALPLACMAVSGAEDASVGYADGWGSGGLSASAPSSGGTADYKRARAEEKAYEYDDGVVDEM